MYRMAMPLSLAHCTKASPRNSGPLSVRRTCGRPWLHLSCSKMRIRRVDEIEVSTSMCSASRLVVDHVEGPEAAATGQCIGHEISRPDSVWQTRHVQRHAFALGQALLGLATQVELHGLVHPVDPLVVPVRSRTTQDLATLPEAAARWASTSLASAAMIS